MVGQNEELKKNTGKFATMSECVERINVLAEELTIKILDRPTTEVLISKLGSYDSKINGC